MRKNDKPIWCRLGLVVAACLLAMSGATAQPAPQRDLALEGGTLIDGTGRAPITDAVIVVEGTRIKAVGKRGQVQIPVGANVINLNGRTILPGLIDVHVHLQDYELPIFLSYGVTTIADFNNDTAWILAQREALQKGRIKGPRLFVSGAFIWGSLQPRDGGTFNSPPADTVEEARALVRSRVASGVDFIKVDLGMTDDVLSAIIDEAKRAGLPLAGHTRNIRRAAELGFKFEEHTDTMGRALIDPEEKMPPKLFPNDPEALVDPKQMPALVDYLVKRGVYLNPTMLAEGWKNDTPRGQEFANEAVRVLKDPGFGFVPPGVKDKWMHPSLKPKPGYANVAEYVREYSAAGGKVLVGTDTGFDPRIPGLAVHDEMQTLVDVGIPPMKVIQGATLWNAQFLNKDRDLGSVEPGKLADIVVIEGNPLANISATKNVRVVIKDGQVIDTKYDAKWVNPIPQPYSSYIQRRLPEITGLSPAMARQGGQTVTVQIDGARFTPNAIAHFDDVALPTHFVSDTELTATLDAHLLQRPPGSYPLYVVNPGLHGNVSTTGYFLVNLKS